MLRIFKSGYEPSFDTVTFEKPFPLTNIGSPKLGNMTRVGSDKHSLRKWQMLIYSFVFTCAWLIVTLKVEKP